MVSASLELSLVDHSKDAETIGNSSSDSGFRWSVEYRDQHQLSAHQRPVAESSCNLNERPIRVEQNVGHSSEIKQRSWTEIQPGAGIR